MQNNDWYADTAYNSRKKGEVPPPTSAGWETRLARTMRAHALPQGVHCGEYRYWIMKDILKDLKRGLGRGMATHEQLSVPSFRNPLVVVALFRWLGGIFSIIGLLTALLSLNTGELSNYDWRNYIFFIVPFFIFVLCSALIKIVPNKNNIVFNRRTGMVTIPQFGRTPPIMLPFAECDGYYFCPQSKTGWSYTLYLGHRFSPQGTILTQQRTDRFVVNADWEYFQQYMDISLPLPDTPAVETYRHLDPTTAAYDKEHNRPPRYWRDFDLKQVNLEIKKGFEIIQKFPWEKLPTDHIPQELMDKVPKIAKMLS